MLQFLYNSGNIVHIVQIMTHNIQTSSSVEQETGEWEDWGGVGVGGG